MEPFGLLDGILVGLLGMAVVFVVLVALSLFIMVLSKLVGLFVPKKSEETETVAAPAAAPVAAAAAHAQPGDIVSLSPACAAFDLYPNFEVRGRHYKDIVNGLQ